MFLFTNLDHLTPHLDFLFSRIIGLSKDSEVVVVFFMKMYAVKFKWTSEGKGIGHKSSTSSGPEVIKLFPCSTQPGTKFILLIKVKMPTTVGILTFISMINTSYES